MAKQFEYHYTPLRGIYWFHLAHLPARPIVRLSISLSLDRIVYALYLQKHSQNPFHIYTCYQETSQSVPCVIAFCKIQKNAHLANSLNL